ncbi:ClpXP protease specificity-enhancing factor [Roseateles violae]|uniref:ClpXP protease specificity-enhancing factor n=1 Tax=Roseateles violae TaxID=3058042 RepID=A0ABT8DY57_9BURK|nr:ClpXP protease specificity-enhancing factor [Pelomonas sp. PFR6]MDN3922172.1 ClpXP protease specificity-enhancing factor [Pelomonas sp. PFR6]
MDQSRGNGDRNGPPSSSTRPYLIRALHDWCSDNGFTPYIAVHVDRLVQVPMEYVSNNEIVLNVGFDATSSLDLGNEFIRFKARFGGVAREIIVPVDHVVAIYARENGQGMAFPAPEPLGAAAPVVSAADSATMESSRPPTPLRGLRLAPSATDAGAPAEPAETAAATETPEGPDQPDGPSGGGRPALKRVK